MTTTNIFLDSGAFSVFKKGAQVDINEYIAFIQEYKSLFSVYVNLDVIANPEATWKNQLYMESKGLHPLPVFHFQDDIKWLHHYINEGYDYIGVGGMVEFGKETRDRYFKRIWYDILTDERGYPKVKVHGFGMTEFALITAYPWYSVDSITWLRAARYGTLYIPSSKNGNYDFTSKPYRVRVSRVVRKSNFKDTLHYDNFSKSQKQYVNRYLAMIGFNVETAREDYRVRDMINISFLARMQDAIPKYPWCLKKKFIAKGIF